MWIKDDPTWTRRCEAARRGAGRSIPAGRRAPNTTADLGLVKPFLLSPPPETQNRKVETSYYYFTSNSVRKERKPSED